MELKSVICKHCNGKIELTEENHGICPYCGTRYLPDYDEEDVRMKQLEIQEEQLRNVNQLFGKFFKTFSITHFIVFVLILGIAITIFAVIFMNSFRHF